MKVIEMPQFLKVILVFINFALMVIMCVIEVVRFRVEYKFRKDLKEKPDLLKEDSPFKKRINQIIEGKAKK
jgi:hypothetical protein